MKQETLEFLNQITAGLVRVSRDIRQDTIDVVATGDHVAVIIHFDQVRKAAELIKEAREALKEISDRLSREQVPDVMREAKIKTTTIEGVGRVTISNKYSATIIDKVGGYNWLRTNDAESLITETVNAQTLASFAKEYVESEGKDLPVEFFKVGTMPFTSITKK